MKHALPATLLCLCLFLLMSPVSRVWSDDDVPQQQSTAQLFDRFMHLYAAGQYDDAKETARQIDPIHLPGEQRVKLYETIKLIDRTVQKSTGPQGILTAADAARRSGDLSKAIGLYKSLLAHPQADAKVRQLANARLADVARLQDRPLGRVRAAIVQADADITAGRYEAAEQKLAEAQASSVRLGWFDRKRLEMLTAKLEKLQIGLVQVGLAARVAALLPAAAAPAPSPAPEPTVPAEMLPMPAPASVPAPTGLQPVAVPLALEPLPAQPYIAPEPMPVTIEPGVSQFIEVPSEQPYQPVAAPPTPQPIETAPMEALPQMQPAQPVLLEPTPAGDAFAPMPDPDVTDLVPESQTGGAIEAAPMPPATVDVEPLPTAQYDAEPMQELGSLPPPFEATPEDGQDVLVKAMKLRASELFEEARDAERNGHTRLAAKQYAEASALDPTSGEARTRYERVGGAVRAEDMPRSILEDAITGTQVRVQATIAEYEQKEASAAQLRKDKKYNDAIQEIRQAKALLDRNEALLPMLTRKQYRDRAEQLEADILKEQFEFDEERKQVEQKKRKTEAEMRRTEALLERFKEVQELLVRALEFNKEQRYDDAIRVLNQALFIEPNNPATQLLLESIEDNSRIVETERLMRGRAVDVANHSLANLDATRPVTDLVQYPEDWPELTNRRRAGFDPEGDESDLNRAANLKLQESLDLPFENNELSSVIDFIRQSTGLNLFVNWTALEQAGISQDLPITLRLTNVPALQALKLVLAQASADALDDELEFTVVDGIVRISTRSDLVRDTVVRVYDIRDLLADVPNFDSAPQFSLAEALSNTNSGGGGNSGGRGGGSGGGGGGGSGGGGGESIFGDTDREDDREGEAEERRIQQIEDISNLIRDTVGNAEEWVANGGTVSSLRELNGQLIVKSTSRNHGDIFGLLDDLRETRAIQIHVEARFLLVDQNFLDEFGLDLDLYVPDTGGNFGPITVAQDSFSIAARPSTGLPGSFLAPTGALLPTILNPANAFGALPSTGLAPGGRGLSFGLAYLDDIQLNLLITASQASRRSIALTAPRITFMNGQTAFIYVARQITFISDLEPIPDAGGFDPTLSVISSGVVLSVTGTVSADRRYVTLTVEPSIATLVQPIRRIPQTALFQQGATAGGQAPPPQILSAFIEAPEIEITEARATVSVPDRGTLLMGGQRLVGEIEVEAGVPVLSKIPIIKRFFTNRSKSKDERTLLILVKPTIIIQSEEEDRLFPGIVQNP